MRVSYYFRHKNIGYSIEHVMNIIIDALGDRIECRRIEMPEERSLPPQMIKNIRYTKRHRDKDGVNHITGHCHEAILGLKGCKTVITIHDIRFIEEQSNPIIRLYKWIFWLHIPLKRADRVVFISENTKRSVERRVGSKFSDKCVVIPNPIDPRYHYYPKVFNREEPRILHIGTVVNKNLKRVIEALSGVVCHLRIIGPLNDEYIDLLQRQGVKYSSDTNLTDEEILKEYQDCDIVSFPSQYEGFGMPVIEGQMVGRAVLTSDIPPMNEIYGGGAHLVDNQSVDSIREGFLRVINDDAYRDELIEKGRENVKLYSAENIAAHYYKIYEEEGGR